MVEADMMTNVLQREFPEAPIVGVGAVVVDRERVLLVQRGREPLKGSGHCRAACWNWANLWRRALCAKCRRKPDCVVEAIELVELIDRIQRESGPSGERVRYHYVIADYLCRVVGGRLAGFLGRRCRALGGTGGVEQPQRAGARSNYSARD